MKSIFIILFLLLFSSFTFGATHTVNQDGSGVDMSVAQFNTGPLTAGDTYYFSGTITTGLVLPSSGSAGSYITLDGWQGGTCDPVADHDALTYGSDNNVDLNACPDAALIDGGAADTNTGVRGIDLNGHNYIIIQDFEIQDTRFAIIEGDSGGSNHNIVRRNYIHDNYDKAIHMVLGGANNSYWTIGGASGDGNFIYNNAEGNRSGTAVAAQHVNISGSNIIVSYNEIANDYRSGDDSNNVVEMHQTTYSLFEYNNVGFSSPGSCLSIKEDGAGNHDLIVRFNKLHDCSNAVSVSGNSGNSDEYIYGNFGYNINLAGGTGDVQAYRVYKAFNNIYFWSNIASLVDERGLAAMTDSRTAGNVFFYNNSVYKAGQDAAESADNRNCIYAYKYDSNLRVNFVNNICSDSDVTNYYAAYMDNLTATQITQWEDNLWYYTGQTSEIYWDGTTYNVGEFQAATIYGDGTTDGDPKFTDANGADNTDGTADDDLTLQSDSPAIGTGTDLGGIADFTVIVQGVTYQIGPALGLDPINTDWTGRIPVVYVLNRDTYGWAKGAYTSFPGPVRRAPYPTSQQPCTTSPNETVTIGLTTDGESDQCKYDTDGGEAYADMSTAFGETGTSHEAEVSQACGGSTTYYVRCTDGTYANLTDLMITVDVDSAPPPASASQNVITGGVTDWQQGGVLDIQ